jgi:exopolyphosphatase / guanosine-5'-triphosphate,3'-diphosphate pyrophosphatase
MRNIKFKEGSYLAWVQMPLFLVILCAVLITGCAPVTQRICIEQRTAFDIGSATMKMKTAKVDKCRAALIGTIQQKEVKVPFAENTWNQILNRDIQNKGIEQLQALKKEALTQGTRTFAGVATAAFRQAGNTPQFLAEIKDKTGVNVKLISQEEEAVLGYRAVMGSAQDPSGNIVVWDIGGNSMQMIMKGRDQNYRVYRGHLASISFKNQIIEKVQHKPSGEQASPNPIGQQKLTPALEIAMQAAVDVPDEIRSYIHQTGTIIIGIGGVHNQSIRKQVGNISTYRCGDLVNALHNRLDLTDTQIGGHYADTDVSNLILVLGFMKKLDIAEVHLMDVNLTDGILIDPAFW